MRILTFLHSFEPGGVERVALRLVARWRAMGVDAPLFMGRSDGALRDELAAALAYRVPPQPRFGSAWWETIWMIARLPAEIRRTAPDPVRARALAALSLGATSPLGDAVEGEEIH